MKTYKKFTYSISDGILNDKMALVSFTETSTKVNIDGSDDPFYRYKTPKMVIAHTSKNTTILKGQKMSNAIKVPEEYMCYFIAFELNTGYGYDNKQNHYYIKGHWDCVVLSKAIALMIDQLVLCQKCNLPELQIVKECGAIWGDCNSCGMKYRIECSDKFVKKITNKKPGKPNKICGTCP